MVSRIAGPIVFALTVAATLSLNGTANAGNDRHDRRTPHFNPGIVGGAGLPSVLPGIGTYAGSISAVGIRGNGIYFAVTHNRAPDRTPYIAPKARIIEVSDDESACSFEGGVCVIRLR